MAAIYDHISEAVAGGLVNTISNLKLSFKTYERLAEEIRLANGAAKPPIDRRKLARIGGGASNLRQALSTHLTLRELAALDVFVRSIGYGDLASILVMQPTVLRSAADAGRIVQILGAKATEKSDVEPTEFISRWDFHTSLHLTRVIDRMQRGVNVEMRDVFLGSVTRADRTARVDELSKQDWQKLLDREHGPSLICVGSPRSCPAAEFMLAYMFGVEPFQPLAGDELETRVPFSFVWTDAEHARLQSAFAMGASAMKRMPGSPAAACARALRVGKEFHPVRNADSTPTTYGVIAAQRQRGGQVWVVCAGLTAPATLGCAKALECMTMELGRVEQNATPEPRWTTIAVDIRRPVKRDPSAGLDERQIERVRWLTGSGVGQAGVRDERVAQPV